MKGVLTSYMPLGWTFGINSERLSRFIYQARKYVLELLPRAFSRRMAFAIGITFISCTALAEDIRVEYERSLPGGSVYDIHFTGLTAGGEIVLCGSGGGGGGAWVGIFSPDAVLVRSIVIEKRQDGAMEDCWTVVAHDVNRTVIAGVTNSRALVRGDWTKDSAVPGETYQSAPKAGLVAFISETGATLFKKAFGNFKPYYQNGFYKGIAVNDGYLLLGNIAKEWPADSPSGMRGVPTIWLVKIDVAGNIVWQFEFSEDDGDVMQAGFYGFMSSPVVLKDGSLIFVPHASPLASTIRNGKPYLLFLGGVKHRIDRQQLILKLGADGKELQRKVVAAGVGGYTSLLHADDQVILIDHPPLTTSDKDKNLPIRIRVRRFDEELNLRESKVIDLNGDEFTIQGAIAGEHGRIFFIGNYVKDLGLFKNKFGEPALAEITTDSRLRIIQRFGSGRLVGIANGTNRDEFVIVRISETPMGESGEDKKIFLTKFRTY